jgi:hypothetical protein
MRVTAFVSIGLTWPDRCAAGPSRRCRAPAPNLGDGHGAMQCSRRRSGAIDATGALAASVVPRAGAAAGPSRSSHPSADVTLRRAATRDHPATPASAAGRRRRSRGVGPGGARSRGPRRFTTRHQRVLLAQLPRFRSHASACRGLLDSTAGTRPRRCRNSWRDGSSPRIKSVACVPERRRRGRAGTG